MINHEKKIGWGAVTFSAITGTVKSVERITKTTVSSSGGGGYIGPNGGHVSATRINSNSVTTLDIWIEDDDNGSQENFQFSENQVSCAPGHRVSIGWGVPKGEKNGPIFYFRNGTANTYKRLKEENEFYLDNMGKFLNPLAKFLAFLVMLLTYYATVMGLRHWAYTVDGYVKIGWFILALGFAIFPAALVWDWSPSMFSYLFGPSIPKIKKGIKNVIQEISSPGILKFSEERVAWKAAKESLT